MSTFKMTPLVIILVTCCAVGGVAVTRKTGKYTNVGLNDKVFTEALLFESPARSMLDCSQQCHRRDSCVFFTSHRNTCRGHSVQMTSCSGTAPAPRARSYVKNGKVTAAKMCPVTTTSKPAQGGLKPAISDKTQSKN